MAQLEASNQLGRYTLLEKIAQGGMAQVFKAKTVDPNGLERLVVIKRILPHISQHPEYVEMLIDEAKIAVHFTHGNIAQVYDLGRVADDYFIVMEYVDGATLSQINKILKERGRQFPWDILLYVFIELCRGLSYMHRRVGPDNKPLGVVHRDVSPQNIILSYAGNVKLIDFGVAKADFIDGKTEAGVLKGKFAYMSPEQARGDALDHRSDIFALGILLWEMATGERLYKRKTNQETVKAVQKAKFDPVSQFRADAPKEIDKILRKAMNKSVRGRYADAAEMARELEKILFALNPDFRPIEAARFVYGVFGPQADERSLPTSPLLALPPENTHKTPKPTVETKSADPEPQLSQTRKPIVHEEATVKERFRSRPDEPTPVVALDRQGANLSRTLWVTLLIAVLFAAGSIFVYGVHHFNPEAYVDLVGWQPGMTLTINGTEMQYDGGELEVRAEKTLVIQVYKPDFLPFQTELTLQHEERRRLLVNLRRPPPVTGDLSIETDPEGASVTLDGKVISAQTPLSVPHLKAGRAYQIVVVLPGYNAITRSVIIPAGEELKLSVPLTPKTD